MKLLLGYLYPDLMNIYGDTGNVIALKKRCEWRGIEFEIKKISLETDPEELKKCDLFFFGGGQDRQQIIVSEDLHKRTGAILKKMLENNTPLLSICGGFQLLGKFYNFEGKSLPGIPGSEFSTCFASKRSVENLLPGINFFDVEARAGKTRFINNVLAETEITGKKELLFGFENHSGRTYILDSKTKPLGRVISGHGNNGEDKTEGAIKNNAIGSYLHGSLLPKNPFLADFLLKKALERKYGRVALKPLEDRLENQAREAAKDLF